MMRFKFSWLGDGTEILHRLFLEHKGALEVSNVFSCDCIIHLAGLHSCFVRGIIGQHCLTSFGNAEMNKGLKAILALSFSHSLDPFLALLFY